MQITPAIIVLKDGAEIYSADENFNQQIFNDKVILKNYDVSYKKNTSKDHFLRLITKQIIEDENKNLERRLKVAGDKRQKETSKHLKKEIERFEKNFFFIKLDFNPAPSSNIFFFSTSISKYYVVPIQNNYNFSKFYIWKDDYLVSHALDFLHSQKYTYYNNKSIDFCFSKVFSVRPPPVPV